MIINNVKIIPATGKEGDKFIGLILTRNVLEFHYPEAFNLSTDEKDIKKDILSIIKTISLAKTYSKEESTYNSKYNKNFDIPVKSYLWIINDYLTNGKYINKEQNIIKGVNGKLNWKKTIRGNAIISNRAIIFNEFFSNKILQKDNLLSDIYTYCVKKSIDYFGWLFNLKLCGDFKNIDGLYNKNKFLAAINDELNHSFNDEKKLRLLNMKNIITGLDLNDLGNTNIVFGVDSYEYVFEKMIDNMFSYIVDKKEFYPYATWKLAGDSKEYKSSNLRPDTILEKNDNLYILDAKYYRYGTTFDYHDLPDTSSIQKQITYEEHVKKAKKDEYKNIFSAFIMPYNKSKNLKSNLYHENIEFIGTAHAKWLNESCENRVAGILVDLKYLVNNWMKKFSNDSENPILNLINKIEANINK